MAYFIPSFAHFINMIYLIIFLAKLIENALTTLRIILLANSKKFIGAILTLVISLIWLLSVSFIVVDLDDSLKIATFAIGSGVGSFIGSIIEERMAIGFLMIIFKTSKNKATVLKEKIKDYNKTILFLENEVKFEVNCTRKNAKKLIKILKKNNIQATIIKAYNLN